MKLKHQWRCLCEGEQEKDYLFRICPRKERFGNRFGKAAALFEALFRVQLFFVELSFKREKAVAVIQPNARGMLRAQIRVQRGQRLIKLTPQMRPTTDGCNPRQRMVALIAIRMQIPLKPLQECCRVFRVAVGGIFIQRNVPPRVAGRAVYPHI